MPFLIGIKMTNQAILDIKKQLKYQDERKYWSELIMILTENGSCKNKTLNQFFFK